MAHQKKKLLLLSWMTARNDVVEKMVSSSCWCSAEQVVEEMISNTRSAVFYANNKNKQNRILLTNTNPAHPSGTAILFSLWTIELFRTLRHDIFHNTMDIMRFTTKIAQQVSHSMVVYLY